MWKQLIVNEYRIHIDGIVKTYTFFQISDSHLAYYVENDNLATKERVETSICQWSRNGISPITYFEEILNYVDRNDSDGLFMCGDIIDFPSGRMIRELLCHIAKLRTEVFYVSGNHEHLEDSNTSFVETSDIELYRRLARPFWAKHNKEITIVGIDNSKRIISNQCIDFLEKQIAYRKPILLIMHIPMYTEELGRVIKKRMGNGRMHRLFYTAWQRR